MAHSIEIAGTAEGGAATAANVRAGSRGVPASILIATIAVLVVVVSLPRFRAHAIDANRKDARVALDLLGSAVFAPALPSRVAERASRTLPDVIRSSAALQHRFPDARAVAAAAGVQLLHHGYRIDTGWVIEGVERRPALVAWPDRYGVTGDVAYALTGDGALWGHPNAGLWSAGEQELAVADLADEGWARLRGPLAAATQSPPE
ncbi:MAG: hypothetical protein AAGB93_25800 [Planctomycetota bacterium]